MKPKTLVLKQYTDRQRQLIVLKRQGRQQQRTESCMVTSPSLQAHTRHPNSTRIKRRYCTIIKKRDLKVHFWSSLCTLYFIDARWSYCRWFRSPLTVVVILFEHFWLFFFQWLNEWPTSSVFRFSLFGFEGDEGCACTQWLWIPELKQFIGMVALKSFALFLDVWWWH